MILYRNTVNIRNTVVPIITGELGIDPQFLQEQFKNSGNNWVCSERKSVAICDENQKYIENYERFALKNI